MNRTPNRTSARGSINAQISSPVSNNSPLLADIGSADSDNLPSNTVSPRNPNQMMARQTESEEEDEGYQHGDEEGIMSDVPGVGIRRQDSDIPADDAGGGAASEPEGFGGRRSSPRASRYAEGPASEAPPGGLRDDLARSGYASDTMNRTSQEMVREQQLLGTTDPSAIQIHGARPPRAQHLARPTVAFSGVSVGARGPLRSTAGAPASARVTAGGATRGSRRPAARDRAERRAAHQGLLREEEDEDGPLQLQGDPLVWTGGSPPPVQPLGPPPYAQSQATNFSLPPANPLLYEPRGCNGSAMASSSAYSPYVQQPDRSKILRCTSYCVALALDLMQLYRALQDAHGLPCVMHKDGLNAVLHCHERNGRDGDAHSFFFSYGCVVTWGLSEAQERERLRLLSTAGCEKEPIAEHEVSGRQQRHITAAALTTSHHSLPSLYTHTGRRLRVHTRARRKSRAR